VTALIKRFSQGLSRAIETVEIVEELVEIDPNEVCDNYSSLKINLNLIGGSKYNSILSHTPMLVLI